MPSLADISSWLVLNAMQNETVQEAALTRQNLETIWRQNAFAQLLEGHQHFALTPQMRAEHLRGLLSEGFVTTTGSTDTLRAVTTVLVFTPEERVESENQRAANIMNSLRTLHCPAGLNVLWCSPLEITTERYNATLSTLRPDGLSIPLTHKVRRERLRKALDISPSKVEVLIFDEGRELITRHGVLLLETCRSITGAVQAATQEDAKMKKVQTQHQKDWARLKEQEDELVPLADAIKAACTGLASLNQWEVEALLEYVQEPEASATARAALKEAATQLQAAKESIRKLPQEAVDALCTPLDAPTPSSGLREAVEAVCVVLGVKADFKTAQLKLLRSGSSFIRKLVTLDVESVPLSVESRLRSFAIGTVEPACDVTAALRGWVLAVLGHRRAADNVAASAEANETSPALSAAVHCVACFCGVSLDLDDGLHRSVLIMASEFPTPFEGNQVDDEIEALLDKSIELKELKVVVSDEEASAAKALEVEAQRTKANHGTISVYAHHYYAKFEEILVAPQTHKMLRRFLGVLLPLLEPTLSAESDLFGAAALYFKGTEGESRLKQAVERFDDVEASTSKISASEWSRMARTLADIDRKSIGTPSNLVLSSLFTWCNQLIQTQKAMTDLVLKRERLEAMKKETATVNAGLDRALEVERASYPDMDVSQLLSVRLLCKQARAAGTPVSIEEASWALTRTSNGDAAIKLVEQLPSARRAIRMLHAPALLKDFDFYEVTDVQARVARSILRGEALRELQPLLHADDTEEGAKKAARTLEHAQGTPAAVAPASGAANASAAPTRRTTSHLHVVSDGSGEGGQPSGSAMTPGKKRSRRDAWSEAELSNPCSIAELELLRWATAVVDHHEKSAKVAPAVAKLRLLEARENTKARLRYEELAKKVDHILSSLPAAGLPLHTFSPGCAPETIGDLAQAGRSLDQCNPWSEFPWREQLAPLTAIEAAIKRAVDLRSRQDLRESLQAGSRVGLLKLNSKVAFDATELLNELQAEEQEVLIDVEEVQTLSRTFAVRERDPLAHLLVLLAEGRSDLHFFYGKLELTGNETPLALGMENGCIRVAKVAYLGATPLGRGWTAPDPMPSVSGATPPRAAFRLTRAQSIAKSTGALKAFSEPVDTTVLDALPRSRKLLAVLSEQCASWKKAGLVGLGADSARAEEILAGLSESTDAEHTAVLTEQEREQEMEEEAEEEAQHEHEAERFLDCNYSRDQEAAIPWRFAVLGETKQSPESPLELLPFADGTFYRASEFRLQGRSPLAFPRQIGVSRNYFNTSLLGDRRLKNAMMCLEYHSVTASGDADAQPIDRPCMELSSLKSGRLAKVLALLTGKNGFGVNELRTALRANDGEVRADADLQAALDEMTFEGDSPTVGELHELLIKAGHQEESATCNFVLISLAEAATIRCIMHLRQGQDLIEGKNVGLRLRCVSSGGIVFDSSFDCPDVPLYSQRVAQSCYRFLDGTMHFAPAEMAILVRSLPTDAPCKRRLFFSSMLACRRRLSCDWRQTSLAKLFYEEDDSSWLLHRALAGRLRGVVAERGLSGHDLFVMADADSDGMLSLGEVASLLEWASPSRSIVAKEDVISFVLSLGSEPRLSYSAFIELICEADSLAAEANASSLLLEDGDAATVIAPSEPSAETRAAATVIRTLKPKKEAPLQAALGRHVMAISQQVASVEAAEALELDRAHALVSERMSEWDCCTWMKARADLVLACEPVQNPHVLLSACFFDFSGFEIHKPAWTSIHGTVKWFSGEELISCATAPGSTSVSLRIPFSRNGGGAMLNQYTITVVMKLQSLHKPRAIMSTSGDLTSSTDANSAGEFRVGTDGIVRWTASKFKSSSTKAITAGSWCTLSLVVDASAGYVKCYVDGKLSSQMHPTGSLMDGAYSLGRTLVLFPQGEHKADWCLRSICIHSRALSHAQVLDEVRVLQTIQVYDMTQRMHVGFKAALRRRHEETPFASSRSVVAAVTELKRAAPDKLTALMEALRTALNDGLSAESQVSILIGELNDHDVQLAGVWSSEDVDEGSSDSIVHIACRLGLTSFIQQLLNLSAHTSREDCTGQTPLIAAIMGGHADVCEVLLRTGVHTEGQTVALHLACALESETTARAIVKEGTVNPSLRAREWIVSRLKQQGGMEEAAAEEHLKTSPAGVLRKRGAVELANALVVLYREKQEKQEKQENAKRTPMEKHDAAQESGDEAMEIVEVEAIEVSPTEQSMDIDDAGDVVDDFNDDQDESSDDDDCDDDEDFWCDEADAELLEELLFFLPGNDAGDGDNNEIVSDSEEDD